MGPEWSLQMEAKRSSRPDVPRHSRNAIIVQGPPGTGKTSTIIGVISAILAKAPRPQPQPPSSLAKGVARAAKSGLSSVSHKSPDPAARVLVCAQSNAAVDELVMRLAEPGIFDREGRRRSVSLCSK